MAVDPAPEPRSPDEDLLETPPHPLLEGDARRISRMRAELAMGFEALAGVERAVTVFGSARTLPGDPEWELARRVSERLGRAGWAIVTGGGPGTMAAANRGARDAGALSVGLTIDLASEEHLNPWIDLSVHFHYFFARKIMFVRYASAFVVFPGGFGTLDELFELLTLTQTRKVRSFPIVLVGRDYWAGLVAWLEQRVLAEGKIAPAELGVFALADEPDEVAAAVALAAAR